MRVKKKNLNEYVLTRAGVWVRNFTKTDGSFVDINRLTPPSDYTLLLNNQLRNQIVETAGVDLENFFHPNVVIVSDGYGFEEKHALLGKLPKNTCIIAVNGALAKWKLFGLDGWPNRAITYYVVNNPYQECLTMLPRKHRYYPKCIASVRTNPEFMSLYKGVRYFYVPVPDENYSTGLRQAQYLIDDYRNPVCAAIGLAYRFGVQKLLLLTCDDAYQEARPGAEKLPNGLWMYSAQRTCQEIVDGNLYWLRNQKGAETKVGVHSSGPVYENAEYIGEEDVVEFFTGD